MLPYKREAWGAVARYQAYSAVTLHQPMAVSAALGQQIGARGEKILVRQAQKMRDAGNATMDPLTRPKR